MTIDHELADLTDRPARHRLADNPVEAALRAEAETAARENKAERDRYLALNICEEE